MQPCESPSNWVVYHFYFCTSKYPTTTLIGRCNGMPAQPVGECNLVGVTYLILIRIFLALFPVLHYPSQGILFHTTP